MAYSVAKLSFPLKFTLKTPYFSQKNDFVIWHLVKTFHFFERFYQDDSDWQFIYHFNVKYRKIGFYQWKWPLSVTWGVSVISSDERTYRVSNQKWIKILKKFYQFLRKRHFKFTFFKALEYSSISLVVTSFMKNDPAQAEDPSLRIRMSYHTSL